MQKSHTSTKHCNILFTDGENILSSFGFLGHAYYYALNVYLIMYLFLEQRKCFPRLRANETHNVHAWRSSANAATFSPVYVHLLRRLCGFVISNFCRHSHHYDEGYDSTGDIDRRVGLVHGRVVGFIGGSG